MANNYFKGKLDGVTVSELSRKIDYGKVHEDERKACVDNILGDTEFFVEYFDNHFDVHLSMEDDILSENNVCKLLEEMGTYLLNSEEEKKRRNEEDKIEYKFHANPLQFQAEVNKERNLEEFNVNDSENGEENILHFLETNKRNSKNLKKQTIKPCDLEREDEVGRILCEYASFLDSITTRIRNLKSDIENGKENADKGKRFILTKTKNTLQEDMINTKDILLGVFGYNISSSNEGSSYSFEGNELNNEEIFREIIRMSSNKEKTRLDSDLFHIFLDVENVIRKAIKLDKLTGNEKIILKGVSEGLRDCDIAREHGWSEPYVNQQLRRTVRKLIKLL